MAKTGECEDCGDENVEIDDNKRCKDCAEIATED